MRVSSRSVAPLRRTQELFAPSIYYFHPLLAGPRRSWPVHLSRCKALGFSHVVSAPLFDPGDNGDLFLSSDHERANPAIEPGAAVDPIVGEFARACQENSLQLLLDIVVGRVATNCTIAKSRPEWFCLDATGARVDPRDTRGHGDAAVGRFEDPTIAAASKR